MSSTKFHISRPAAWIEVTGEDSFDFLQGQFSNDLRSPAPTPATYGLWLDRKGRILADSFILQKSEEEFYLFSISSPAETIIERLDHFIIGDDVSLRDLTAETSCATIIGDRIDDVLTAAGFERPDRGSFLQFDHRFLFPGYRSLEPSLDCVITGPDNEETVAALSAAVKEAGGEIIDQNELERERIAAGIPSIPADAGPRELPQEAAFLEENAISYTKGCYTGQEIMARIRSMGQVRRVLVQVELDQKTEDLPASLFNGEKEVGKLSSLTDSEPWIGLALIRREAAEAEKQLAIGEEKRSSVRISKTYP